MVRKILFLAMLAAGLCLTTVPAWAYIDLILTPESYQYYDGAPVPELTVAPSDEFTLYLRLFGNETKETAGLDAYLSFDSSLVEVSEVGASEYEETPSPVVDENGSPFTWDTVWTINEGNNTDGTVTYNVTTIFGTTQTINSGANLLGSIKFHCKAEGDVSILVSDVSWLYDKDDPELNLLNHVQGTLVHQGEGEPIIPEPATMILLGSGLVASGFVYRRRK